MYCDQEHGDILIMPDSRASFFIDYVAGAEKAHIVAG